MNLLLDIVLVVALTIIVMWLTKKITERVINLIILFKYKKRDNLHNIESSGIVYNKKTNKLEATPDKTVLPF
ncbi:MAG: hypothetical protein IJZ30_04235 [Alphaproteobacteria bacterium]|nr:hypothetical protein [Alphaproteobacteria bacterium]